MFLPNLPPVVSCLGWQPEEPLSRQSPGNYGAKHTLFESISSNKIDNDLSCS